jgi:hypothetical protein
MKKNKKDPMQHEEEYVAFLKKRLESKHFLENATPDEVAKTKVKYDKAKFKLRVLKKGR